MTRELGQNGGEKITSAVAIEDHHYKLRAKSIFRLQPKGFNLNFDYSDPILTGSRSGLGRRRLWGAWLYGFSARSSVPAAGR